MKRKFKKRHWGAVVGVVLIVAILAVPVDVYVNFIFGTQRKVEVTKEQAGREADNLFKGMYDWEVPNARKKK